MVFGNGVKSIQAAAYNGARTVYCIEHGPNIFELADGLGIILKNRKGKISSNCKLNQCTNCAWRARVSLILRTYSISQCLILKNLISQRMLNKLMVHILG